MFYLYRHIRLDNGYPFYIGIGKVVLFHGHERTRYGRAYSKKRRGNYWRRIAAKHGYEVEILYESENEVLIKDKEVEFIKLYGRKDLGTGFLVNRTNGREGNYSDDILSKISAGRKGKTHTLEAKSKISAAGIGRKHSPGAKNLMSIRAKERGMPFSVTNAASAKRIRAVTQLEISGEFLKEWPSIISAANELKIDRSDIVRCCKGKKKIAGGYHWSCINKSK